MRESSSLPHIAQGKAYPACKVMKLLAAAKGDIVVRMSCTKVIAPILSTCLPPLGNRGGTGMKLKV